MNRAGESSGLSGSKSSTGRSSTGRPSYSGRSASLQMVSDGTHEMREGGQQLTPFGGGDDAPHLVSSQTVIVAEAVRRVVKLLERTAAFYRFCFTSITTRWPYLSRARISMKPR